MECPQLAATSTRRTCSTDQTPLVYSHQDKSNGSGESPSPGREGSQAWTRVLRCVVLVSMGGEMLTRERERVRGSRVAREKKGEKQMSEKGRRALGRSEEGTDTRRQKEIRQEGIDGVGA